MSEVCVGTRRDGLPCVSNATEGSGYCYKHDPQRAAERKKNAAKGGAAHGGRSKVEMVERIRQDMRSVAGSVLEGKVSSRAGDTIIKALNGELRALTELHKMQDLEDVRRRLDALEEQERYG
jgi:hypothetical protein